MCTEHISAHITVGNACPERADTRKLVDRMINKIVNKGFPHQVFTRGFHTYTGSERMCQESGVSRGACPARDAPEAVEALEIGKVRRILHHRFL